jgi:hypothetical protein
LCIATIYIPLNVLPAPHSPVPQNILLKRTLQESRSWALIAVKQSFEESLKVVLNSTRNYYSGNCVRCFPVKLILLRLLFRIDLL